MAYPNCSCGAGGHNAWNHSTSCLWFGSENDPPFNNAMKMRLQDKFWMDSTGENLMPVEPMEMEEA